MQQNGIADLTSISIGNKLAKLSPLPSDCCIYKVNNQLREVNEKAYEPDIVAIGPYHHGKDSLKMMEEHKLRYLQFRLQQKNENVKRYIDAMSLLEEKARKCYAEPLNLKPDELVEMMLLDGFFIIELFRKFEKIHLRETNDPIFRMDWIVISLQRDLILFENQLPFFVLCKLYDMIEAPNQQQRFNFLAKKFLNDLVPGPGSLAAYPNGDLRDKVKHLLGFLHDVWILSVAERKHSKDVGKKNEKWQSIHCATVLREAGIKFEKIEKDGSLFDIKFENGVMKIPILRIEDRTESLFRNLIVYEQYCDDISFKFVSDYVKFMDSLIDSAKDVGILGRRGIIDNWLGDDEVVSNIFNKITDWISGSNYEHFHYAAIFERVNKHCNKQGNLWMAKLRRNYLSSPWAIISVLAAFVLLALTLTQTVVTIIK